MTNKTLIYKKLPHGLPVAGQDLVVEDRPIDLVTPPEGGQIFEVLSVSLDPYLRGRLRDPKIKSYSPAFDLDGPISEDTVSRVLKSDSADLAEGDLVIAHVPVAEYARIPAKAPLMRMLPSVRKIHNPYGLPLGHFLGALGMPGLTAYSGLYQIGKPKAGETLFVSSAAGAVGQLVGQLAKREGLTVIGSVGSQEKLDFVVKELGFDAAFNYKEERAAEALPRLAPGGIDIYFDNVGGEQLDAALVNMKVGGRIAACGMVSGGARLAALTWRRGGEGLEEGTAREGGERGKGKGERREKKRERDREAGRERAQVHAN